MKKIMMLAAVAILAAACVTQKSRSDISPVKKFYHDLNSEFNGYFNAGELYDAAIVSLEEQHSDNYNKLLPIYAYSAADNPQAVAPDMDEAIKKVTVIRALHEPSHWIDDCYLMAGKAQFLKQDYESAEETLRFLVDEFSPDAKLKKSRSKKKRTSGSKPVTTAQKKAVEREREQEQKVKEDERKEKAQTREQERKQKEKDRKAAKKQKEKEYKQRKKERAKELKARKKARARGESVPSRRKTEVVDDGAEEETEEKTDRNSDEARQAARDAKKEAADAEKRAEEEAKQKEEQAKRAAEIAKEEKDRPFKHRSAHQEGQLWLARTLIERDKFDQANYLIEGLERNENLYNDVAKELEVVKAHYFIQQKEYDAAITPLENAKEAASKRTEKARFAYILAQIYQQKNQPATAMNYFKEVVKLKPEYEMEFSARMSMTLSEYHNGTASSESAIKSLEKMLKDEKNIDYKDRIYFAMSEIYLKDGQEEKGIEYLKKALKEGGGNQSQKAEALVKLAYLFYNEEDYVKAVEYFGEALTLLPKTDERYSEIERLNKTIADVAANIKMVELQDSLLNISRMSNDEKRDIAYQIRQQQLKEQAERAKQTNNRNSKYGGRTSQVAIPGGTATGGVKSNFFAYDDRAVKRGKRSFERAWGTGRILEDNWRRSNRQSNSGLAENEEDESASNRLSDEEVATILRGVPQSQKQIEGAENTLADAMFELGSLYRERLQNYKKSIETFEDLLERFPDYSNKAEALYYLYLSNNDLNNTSKAKQYRDQLIREFPDSVYGQLLTDPNYLAKLNAEEMKLTNFYNSIYSDFIEDNYQSAFDSLQVVDKRFGTNNPLQPRFALLDAMTRGKLEGKEAYVKSLKDVVAKYPNTDEQRRAREILRLLGTNVNTIPGGEATTGEVYKYEPDKLHYLIIALNASAVLNDVKISVSDYNRKYHSQDKLRISNIYLDSPDGDGQRTPLVVVRRFKTADDVMKYYDGVMRNKKDFIDSDIYELYPITQTNYREVLRNKNLSDYKPFFEANYLKK